MWPKARGLISELRRANMAYIPLSLDDIQRMQQAGPGPLQPRPFTPDNAPELPHPQPSLLSPGLLSGKIPSVSLPKGETQPQAAYQSGLLQKKAEVNTAPDAGSAAQARNNLLDYENNRPWESRSTLGKIGKVASTIGNVAGDVFLPRTMSLIPGTQLNREAQRGENDKEMAEASENELKGAQAGEQKALAEGNELVPYTMNGVEQMIPRKAVEGYEAAKLKADTTARDTVARGQNALDVQGLRNEGAQTTQGLKNEGTKTVADIHEAGANTRNTAAIASREQMAKMADETRRAIAASNEQLQRDKLAVQNDPNKLTVAMKNVKQQAQAVLPGIANAIDETDHVSDLLGPEQGRWNDFMQGKIGISDQRYAHYKDEIGFVESAVALAHARGRMSDTVFNHFKSMFDSGRQSADNMKVALQVAQEWMNDYAHLGEPAQGAPAAGTPAGVPAGAKVHTLNDFLGK